MKIIYMLMLVMLLSLTISCKRDSSSLANDLKSELEYTALVNKDMKYEDFSADKYDTIILAGGCFWGVEKYFQYIDGVVFTDVGYVNSKTDNPSYKDVTSGTSDASEGVRIVYDPKKVSLDFILDMYVKVVDPTSLNKQGNDRGRQYRTGIYYDSDAEKKTVEKFIKKISKDYKEPIAIEVMPVTNYYVAEDYHQDYLDKNPTGYCHIGKAEFEDAKKAKDNISSKIDKDEVVSPAKKEYRALSDEELKSKLTKLQYDVTQKNKTEQPFENEYWDNKEEGVYVDIVSGEPLFLSKDKFNSSSGWPSFSKPIDKNLITNSVDKSLGMDRTEVKSSGSDSHLGHLFNDGPKESGGMRYCINSASLRFVSKSKMVSEGYGYLLNQLSE